MANATRLDRANRSKIQIGNGAPGSSTKGNVYIDALAVSNSLYINNGSGWQQVIGVGGVTATTPSITNAFSKFDSTLANNIETCYIRETREETVPNLYTKLQMGDAYAQSTWYDAASLETYTGGEGGPAHTFYLGDILTGLNFRTDSALDLMVHTASDSYLVLNEGVAYGWEMQNGTLKSLLWTRESLQLEQEDTYPCVVKFYVGTQDPTVTGPNADTGHIFFRNNGGDSGIYVKTAGGFGGWSKLGSGAGGYWDRTSTVLSPATAGDTLEVDMAAVTTGNAIVIENDCTPGTGNGDLGIRFNGSGGTEAARIYNEGGTYGNHFTIDCTSTTVGYFSTALIRFYESLYIDKDTGSCEVRLTSTGNGTVSSFVMTPSTGATSLTSGDTLTFTSGTSEDIFFNARAGGNIPFNESGETSLSGFTATSIIGALNELAPSNVWRQSGNRVYGASTPIYLDIQLPGETTGNAIVVENDGTASSGDLGIQFNWDSSTEAARLYTTGTGSTRFDIDVNNVNLFRIASDRLISYNSMYMEVTGGYAGLYIGTSATFNMTSIFVNTADGSTTVNSLDSMAVNAGSDDDLTFQARGSSNIPLNQSGDINLSGFTATSIVGALNELKLGGGSSWTTASNTDIDTGTETVDSFDPTADGATVWHYFLTSNDGTNIRSGTINCSWDDSAGTANYLEVATSDTGDTSDVTLAVDMSGVSGTVRLRATTTSDNWTVRVIRAPTI